MFFSSHSFYIFFLCVLLQSTETSFSGLVGRVGQLLAAATAMAEKAGFEQLTRRHGLKVPVGAECSVEDTVLAVGEVVGHESIRSASRMNGAVVLFLNKVEKVNDIVESGIVINDRFVKIFPLVNPARKVLLSNVPPFISDEALQREL